MRWHFRQWSKPEMRKITHAQTFCRGVWCLSTWLQSFFVPRVFLVRRTMGSCALPEVRCICLDNCQILLYVTLWAMRNVHFRFPSILNFRIPHNTLCLPPKFCINHCFQMLLGICSVPKSIWKQKFGFVNGVDNVNWPPYRDSKSWRFER